MASSDRRHWRMTANGALVVTGRNKDLIICGGENISAQGIEAVFQQHPGVAVVAMAHPRLGEGVCAFVVVRERAAVDALPHTASGKVRKDVLRAEANEGNPHRGLPRHRPRGAGDLRRRRLRRRLLLAAWRQGHRQDLRHERCRRLCGLADPAGGRARGCDVFVPGASSSGAQLTGDWRTSFEFDLTGPVRGREALQPHLEKSGKGSVVVMSSTAVVETFLMP